MTASELEKSFDVISKEASSVHLQLEMVASHTKKTTCLWKGFSYVVPKIHQLTAGVPLSPDHRSAAGQSTRRGRGRGNRSRGKVNVRRDGMMKFEEDFDFETANAQFHKDEIDKEFQTKLKLKGTSPRMSISSVSDGRFMSSLYISIESVDTLVDKLPVTV